jgi:hypothetical protein
MIYSRRSRMTAYEREKRPVGMRGFVLLLLCIVSLGLPELVIAESIGLPRTSGNRILPGSIELNYAIEISVSLPEPPVWIVGNGSDESSTWFVLLEDSRVFRIVVGEFGETAITDLGRPALSSDFIGITGPDSSYTLLPRNAFRGNATGYPLYLESRRVSAAIGTNGLLYVGDDDMGLSPNRSSFLLDSRILEYDENTLLVLGAPSGRYRHGILGDLLEPTSYHIIDIQNEPRIVGTVELEDTSVFETLAPIIADTDDDGRQNVVMTRSDVFGGARLEVYSEMVLLASSEPVGQSNRWVHALAVAPTGAKGETEIIAVKTPHIGGKLEYYRHEDDGLKLVHTRTGVSTHTIGSRNLDMALTGDFNDDGEIEVLVPSQDFRRLLSIKRTEDGSEIDATQYLQAQLSTNIAGYSFDDLIYIAIGTVNGEFVLIRNF